VPKVDEIINTRYIKSLSGADQKALFLAFDAWPAEQQKEFVEEIMKMESLYDEAVEEKTKELQQEVLGLESTMADLKRTEITARHEDESTQKKAEISEVEALISQS